MNQDKSARLEVARQLAGMAETYADQVTDHYTRQALGHLISAVRELADKDVEVEQEVS